MQTLDDERLAAIIRHDNIDVLLDLAGHTRGNRLLMFGRRPAPVQASWMGYVGTTGLTAIDFLLADQYVIPLGTEANYCEQIVRLPNGWLCYSPAENTPEVSPPPCLERGYVTFGCFNNCPKIGMSAVAAWAELLRRLPDSRLLLKFKWFDDAGVRQRLRNAVCRARRRARRIEMRGWTPQAEHLECYAQIDLALRYVPLYRRHHHLRSTLDGRARGELRRPDVAGRQSYSHLSNVGLSELGTSNWRAYVDRAVEWSADFGRLEQTRKTLRPRMQASPLCDARLFANHLTQALETMWQQGQPKSPVVTDRLQMEATPTEKSIEDSRC